MKSPKSLESPGVIIGPESSLTGTLSTTGVARIDGTMEGSVTADWLIVGETGCVRGDAVSRGTMVKGRMEGNIKANESVEIGSHGIVEGELSTPKLRISEGACFDGRSRMRGAGSDGRAALSLQKAEKQSRGTASDSNDES